MHKVLSLAGIFNYRKPSGCNDQNNVSVHKIDFSNRYLLVQRQQWEHQNNMWNPFKVNNKDTRRRHTTHCSGAPIVDFEQVNIGWVVE